MPIPLAFERTRFADDEEFSKRVLCAEFIPNRAKVFYCMNGSDTIAVTIIALSLRQLKAECYRITRQMERHGLKLSKVEASILVEANGSDVDILSGERVTLLARWWVSLKDRFFGKFVPAVVCVFLTADYMAGTSALKSAEIGLVAAILGALADAGVAANASDSWQWKESK